MFLVDRLLLLAAVLFLIGIASSKFSSRLFGGRLRTSRRSFPPPIPPTWLSGPVHRSLVDRSVADALRHRYIPPQP
jgi:hypothetical protein